jgi:hypothetical protein
MIYVEKDLFILPVSRFIGIYRTGESAAEHITQQVFPSHVFQSLPKSVE